MYSQIERPQYRVIVSWQVKRKLFYVRCVHERKISRLLVVRQQQGVEVWIMCAT